MIRILMHATAQLMICALLACLSPAAQAQDSSGPGRYDRRDDVQRFIAVMVDQHGFTPSELERTLGQARFQPVIIKAMMPLPSGQRSWQAYRARFLTQRRIADGAKFWMQHHDALVRAAAIYGVPEEIIVAIIGVETEYGRNMGSFRVIDALVTLAFDYPRRADFFRSELENFLLYARESNIDVLRIKGSFAGAVGIPQFMPGSYRRYAVDFDRDGRRDLHASPVDAIGSVANFLHEHGWERGQPIAMPAETRGIAPEVMAAAGIMPAIRAGELEDYGVSVGAALDPELLCALIELETPNQPSEYWVGLQNFYALTRYNQSSFYAISVIELANALSAEVKR